LIYDLILIGPFIGRFSVVPDENLLSLSLYVFVLIFSATVAVWLFWFDWAQDKPRVETA
jgi:membrane protein DedA with SNARE-associated domain